MITPSEMREIGMAVESIAVSAFYVGVLAGIFVGAHLPGLLEWIENRRWYRLRELRQIRKFRQSPRFKRLRDRYMVQK